jgi:cation diffusion facilitator family transporter
MRRSARPPDTLHPFGHGKVLYFYSLLVAVYIFGIGGVFAIQRGIAQLRNPASYAHFGWNYAVLALAAALDFYSWRIFYLELRSRKEPEESTWDEIIGSKDPTVFTVFLEDSAGLAGTFLAFLGIFLGRLFHLWYLDPIASVLIGLLLAAVAVLLGRESGALLVGERTNRARIKRVEAILRADPAVEDVGDLLTMHAVTMNVLYPKFIGKRVRLNPLAVLLSLLFWAWIWGAVGLVLAVPIVGAAKIVCDYTDSLKGLGIWLGE